MSIRTVALLPYVHRRSLFSPQDYMALVSSGKVL